MVPNTDKEAALLQQLAEVRPDLAFGQPYEWRAGGEADILLFENEAARFLYKPDIEQMRCEQLVMSKIAHPAYMTPEISYVSAEGHLNVQTRISGKPLVPEDFEGSAGLKLSQMTHTDMNALGKGIAAFLVRLHKIIPDDQALHGLRKMPQEDAKASLQKFLAICPDEKLKVTLAVLMHVQEDTNEALIHGDLGYGNIFFDKKKQKCGVIDFGRLQSGPPAADFAYFATMPSLIYSGILNEYNRLSPNKIDYRQPLLYMAAIYSSLYCKEAGQQKSPAHALMRLRQVSDLLEKRTGNNSSQYRFRRGPRGI